MTRAGLCMILFAVGCSDAVVPSYPVDLATAMTDGPAAAPDLAMADLAGADLATGGCSYIANTAPSSTVNPAGCHVLDRDTSACMANRTAAGLSGPWLQFSCRVALSKSGGTVQAMADGNPDHRSNYYPTSNACWESYTGATQNPNLIATKSYAISFPTSPTPSGGTPMMGAVVGLAVDGVPIFGNFAAPGDDIFFEAMTFDRCGGHPTPTSAYHYHAEPYALSYDDGRLIGYLRDGYPVYGRRDPGGTMPVLDSYGGHVGKTPDSPSTDVYHYHVNLQTSSGAMTSGQTAWFITKGSYAGTPAACGTCN